jgi:NCS1 family nucleobase:cation symporter-1
MADEYEREPVPERAQLGFRSFVGMYAGEHTAGTEFMLGPLFVAWGANAFDLIVGLLLGNILAVLTWRFLTAEIATSERLTLYYKLEKISGRHLATLYNFFNGVLFCFLAGAMVTVSATAVGVPFGGRIPMPTFEDKWPVGAAFVAICVLLGLLMTAVAIRGYAFVARVGQLAAPWMFLVFVACALVVLGRMGTADLFALIATPEEHPHKIPFWGIVAFAWFCNSAMHLGMADLSVLRFARRPQCGWASATGMFLGHYVAWICAALLLVYWVRERGATLARGETPGVMAFDAVGWAGLMCVVIAGWTTANPTIYRAGLAFQGMFPQRLTRTSATLLAGLICTGAAIFPSFAMQLLNFVGIYGTILAPVGAIIAVDHFLARKVGVPTDFAARSGVTFNLAVLLAWAISVGVALFFWVRYESIQAFYLPLPAWLGCGLLYILFAKFMNRTALAPEASTT